MIQAFKSLYKYIINMSIVYLYKLLKLKLKKLEGVNYDR